MIEFVNFGIGVLEAHDRKMQNICKALKRQIKINSNLNQRITLLALGMTTFMVGIQVGYRKLEARVEKLEQQKEE